MVRVNILVFGYRYTNKAGRVIFSKKPVNISLLAEDTAAGVRKFWETAGKDSKIVVGDTVDA